MDSYTFPEDYEELRAQFLRMEHYHKAGPGSKNICATISLAQ